MLRMMVDIANKALSPSVNDPTTAVQVLDHIGELLAFIGSTDLTARTKAAASGPPRRYRRGHLATIPSIVIAPARPTAKRIGGPASGSESRR